MALTLVVSTQAQRRLDRAGAWLAAHPASREVLVVAPHPDAANELLRGAAAGTGAAFGWHRATLPRLAAQLTAGTSDRTPVGSVGTEALVARVVASLRAEGVLEAFGTSLEGPGFPGAVSRVLTELRMAGVEPAALAGNHPELAALLTAFAAGLDEAGLVDRPALLQAAAARVADPAFRHPWLERPTLVVDVAWNRPLEAGLLRAVLARAPEALLTLPSGDESSLRVARGLANVVVDEIDASAPSLRAIDRVQTGLFAEQTQGGALDASVAILSAPGESRESVEIARRIVTAARSGTPFDRMAILLRSPEEYRPHLEEALGRAKVPAHFARGARRPHPAGRAFIALLACAAEGLSARRFSEYLSLSQVPDPDSEGAPPPPTPVPEHWVAPDDDALPRTLNAVVEADTEASAPPDPDQAAVRLGTLRSPRRWERLLVDAAVIGGRDRWVRRLDGLQAEIAARIEELEDPDDPYRATLERRAADLDALQRFAMPVLDRLADFPDQALWSQWLIHLGALATTTLRWPRHVLALLAELAPMGPLGPVTLAEVRLVLEARLLETSRPPESIRYGKVFVGPAEAARGLSFDTVFVPALAERLFPRKISEEPFLLDKDRVPLHAALETNEDRVASERLALHLAVGAASQRLVFSYPRLDLELSRPRVPSFYALEALRAATGTLPDFEQLAERAETVSQARLGWPAPPDPRDAIDDAEHDLAVLRTLLLTDREAATGGARYLLAVNPHLGRSLRTRPRRSLRRWTFADGLVDPSETGRAALARHLLDARSYSPTALQNFSSCPYRFFLSAVHRLRPREEPMRMEQIDPLARGSLVHEVQFRLLSQLRDDDALPLGPDGLDRAYVRLDAVLDAVAAQMEDDLAPAIDQVWKDAIASIRDDLREWLERMSEDSSGWVPWRFELSFGLSSHREGRDPHSVDEPVRLANGISLRGSIDLVERRADGSLRATDYKTGKERFRAGAVTEGGAVLQPVLYAMVLDTLFPETNVESGRLYYCTAAGGFQERTVPLDDTAREAGDTLAEVVGGSLRDAFLPAAPAEGACRWCDYVDICGTDEENRVARKTEAESVAARIAPLTRLRSLS